MKISKIILSYFLILAMFIPAITGINAFALADSLYPADGGVYYESPEYFKTDLTGYEKAIFYLDGIKLGEADSSGVFYPPEALSFGSHNLKVIKIASDKSAVVQTANFKIYATSVIKQQHDNFDDFDPEDKTTLNYAIDTKDVMEIEKVPGRSGEADDYAFSLRYLLGKKSKSSKSYFQPGTFKQYSTGISEAEFDIKLNTEDTTISMSNFMIDGVSGFDVIDGKWKGTNVAVIPGEWAKLKFFIDADNDKYEFYVNGNKELSGNMDPAATYSNFRIKLFSSVVASDGYRPGIEFDNFHAVNRRVYKGISKLTYVNNETEIDSSANIPSDASLKVYVEEGLANNENINTQNIIVKTLSGINIPLSSVSYNEGEKSLLIVPASAFPFGETLEVTLNDKLSFADNVSLGGNHSVRGTVVENLKSTAQFKKNGNPLYSSYQLSEGDIISATISVTNNSLDKSYSPVCILTERKDGRLISIIAKTLSSVGAGQTAPSFTLTLPNASAGEGSEVKLMIWDGYNTPQAIGKLTKLE